MDNKLANQKCLRLETVESKKNSSVVELELAMTNSAIGFEYALQALDSKGALGLESNSLTHQIEEIKHSYFSARQKLFAVDASRALNLEKVLVQQKAVMFVPAATLH